MKSLSLKEVQAIELEILLELKKVCQKNGLVFSLAGGTMLGAARHKGFIPWDDDFDVMMPRPDYERLIELAKNDTSLFLPEYKLYAFELRNAVYPFAKLVNRNSHLEEEKYKAASSSNIWIDIMPVDGLPDNDEQIEILYKRMKSLRRLVNICRSKTVNGTPVIKAFKNI